MRFWKHKVKQVIKGNNNNMVNIKGNNIQVSGDCHSISTRDGKVIINGKEISLDGTNVSKPIHIYIEGDVEKASTTNGALTITGNAGDVTTTNGKVVCKDVGGDVDTYNGHVNCGSVAGKVKTHNGNIRHK